MSNFSPKFPLYVPTKGRHMYMFTSKALTTMGVHHYLVVEPQEVDDYQNSVDRLNLLATVLPMDMTFKETYELCDDFGLTKSTGPGPARNFAWEHSISSGYDYHWVMDDNINWFFRYNENRLIPCRAPGMFRAMEDFTLRYDNLYMSGPNYFAFISRKLKYPAFVTNTRIYSCNFIRNDYHGRWRGRYNEDTILSIDMLKDGLCTVQFNAFIQDKMETQKLQGGNSTEFYWAEGEKIDTSKYTDTGTLAKSQMLVDVHPDISTVVQKFGRIHHNVYYGGFNQVLKFKKDFVKPSGDDEYGMNFKQVSHYKATGNDFVMSEGKI